MPAPGLPHHFYTMAANNTWANHRLLTACARLSQEDFVATRTSFFPSLRTTLNHNITVDWYYVEALERALHGQPVNTDIHFFDTAEPFARCSQLLDAQHQVDRRLLDLCHALTGKQMEMPVGIQRRSGIQYETLTRLLAHLFEHQIHHRGQAHAMLAGTPVKPPQLDEFFCANEAHLRVTELTTLGLTENMIWEPPPTAN